MLIPGGAAALILLQYMACSTNWLSRHPLKVEVAGSNPAQVTILAALLYSEEIDKIASLYFVFCKFACKNAKYSCNYCRQKCKSLAATLWVGSPAAKAAVCKTATLDTPKVRVLPGPP